MTNETLNTMQNEVKDLQSKLKISYQKTFFFLLENYLYSVLLLFVYDYSRGCPII